MHSLARRACRGISERSLALLRGRVQGFGAVERQEHDLARVQAPRLQVLQQRRDLARVIQTGMRRTHPLLRDFQPLSDVSDIVEFGAWVADHGADDPLGLPTSNGKTDTERRARSTT